MAAALLLERRVYERIAADPTATTRAIAIVLLIALAHGASGLLRARAFGWDPVAAPLFGVVGELAFWAGAGLSGATVTHRWFDASASLGAYYRVLGLSSAPGVFIIVAATASIVAPGTEYVALPLVALYRGAALVVAIQSTSGHSRAQGAIASGAVVVGGLSTVAAVTVALNVMLPG